MPPKPYIGVTGFMSRSEVERVLAALPLDTDRRLMVGLLMSDKTLAGGVSSKYPGRYPTRDKMGSIFVDDPRAFNLVHFHTRTTGYAIVAELIAAKTAAGPYCHGFQLNMKWPSWRVLDEYRRVMSIEPRRDTIILQCGAGAIAKASHSPYELAWQVAGYADLIDYVLIDPSGGKGLLFDVHFAHDCLAALTETVPSIGVGIAGGLSAQTLQQIWALTLLWGGCFSIDAEGQLRDDKDKLDVTKAIEYVAAAHKLFQECAEEA